MILVLDGWIMERVTAGGLILGPNISAHFRVPILPAQLMASCTNSSGRQKEIERLS